jgi:hypothetical protein
MCVAKGTQLQFKFVLIVLKVHGAFLPQSFRGFQYNSLRLTSFSQPPPPPLFSLALTQRSHEAPLPRLLDQEPN